MPAACGILGRAGRRPDRGADSRADHGVSGEGINLLSSPLSRGRRLSIRQTCYRAATAGNNRAAHGTGCEPDGLLSAEMDRQAFRGRAGLSQGEREMTRAAKTLGAAAILAAIASIASAAPATMG